MPIDFESWPVLPQELRPRKLYHMSAIPEDIQGALASAGWEPVDVRTLPENTPEEKEFAIKAWLQGVRLKSIEPGRGQIHFAELEGRVYGLLLAKKPEEKPKTIATEDLDAILGAIGKPKDTR